MARIKRFMEECDIEIELHIRAKKVSYEKGIKKESIIYLGKEVCNSSNREEFFRKGTRKYCKGGFCVWLNPCMDGYLPDGSKGCPYFERKEVEEGFSRGVVYRCKLLGKEKRIF